MPDLKQFEVVGHKPLNFDEKSVTKNDAYQSIINYVNETGYDLFLVLFSILPDTVFRDTTNPGKVTLLFAGKPVLEASVLATSLSVVDSANGIVIPMGGKIELNAMMPSAAASNGVLHIFGLAYKVLPKK